MENIHGFSNLLAVLQGYKLCKYFDYGVYISGVVNDKMKSVLNCRK